MSVTKKEVEKFIRDYTKQLFKECYSECCPSHEQMAKDFIEKFDTQSEPMCQAVQMPGASGFTMACFKASDVPVGTDLYTAPQPLEDEPVAWVDLRADVLKFGGWDAQPFAKSFKPVFFKVKK